MADLNAREAVQLPLEDVLALVALDGKTDKYERAAARWLGPPALEKMQRNPSSFAGCVMVEETVVVPLERLDPRGSGRRCSPSGEGQRAAKAMANN